MLDIEDLFRQAKSQFRKEKYAAALLLCSKILGHEPKNAEAWYLRAQTKYHLGNIVGALQDLTAALTFDPDHVLARAKRAEYAQGLLSTDDRFLLETLPEYCKQFYPENRDPSVNYLPSDLQRYLDYALYTYRERAIQVYQIWTIRRSKEVLASLS